MMPAPPRCAMPFLTTSPQAGFNPTPPDAADMRLLKERYTEYCRLADGLRSIKGDALECDLQAAIRQALELCGEEAPLHPAAAAAATATTTAAAPPADPVEPAAELWTAKMHLGKYEGRRLTKLPGYYIAWMCREPGFFESSPQNQELRERLLALGLVRHEGGGLVLVPPDSHAARMPIGKHHGTLLVDLPTDHVEWVCRADVEDKKRFFDGSPRKAELLRHLIQLGRVRQVGNLVVPCAPKLRYGPYGEDWYPEDYDDYYYPGEEYEENDDAGV
ncbi:hypothetical protein TSOC_008380 [Tetrabaena socialis]|uniref:Uncharacterized protein n=1 Tax=Tetrabaena socialis TaxID=47790 RepID=A0A2J7ZYP0_9CHLO|nr:hypothetical protein TSOC_008380 [Tetrabaena socialis]|eukprot:PNH05384.1 hypothetical protein TSOC_008380 [Tetrabaena socialis]